jgi:Putative Actinobacterial Holin-X, holin superfamily III
MAADGSVGGNAGEYVNGGQRSIGTLLRDLAEGGTQLMRQEIRLARLELGEVVASVGKGTASVAVGGVLALLGALAVLSGIILLAGDQWLRDRYWLAALIVTVIAGGLALWFARRGMALLSARQLVPDQTVATIKEDKEWLKRQLTSGATSK